MGKKSEWYWTCQQHQKGTKRQIFSILRENYFQIRILGPVKLLIESKNLDIVKHGWLS